ncbi:hypothetical protein BM86_24205 [Bacillus thuringiensis]|uniref:Insecticidal binary-like toxin n=1 Tax=Bacillus thuringiensis TaxID=1428 RepID=A0A9W3SIL5_BACTU|nr:hypothetical protein [Bacillus thuringiensis]ANS52220.1 putative insecticidal binary-like toxin [Bacillus thuringiensis]MBH0338500.1 hypothetical protein [Bacillus thuringiensis]
MSFTRNSLDTFLYSNNIKKFKNKIIKIKPYQTSKVIGYAAHTIPTIEPEADTDTQTFILYFLDNEKCLLAHTFTGNLIHIVKKNLDSYHSEKQSIDADLFSYHGYIHPNIKINPYFILKNTSIPDTYTIQHMHENVFLIPSHHMYGPNYLGTTVQHHKNQQNMYWTLQAIKSIRLPLEPGFKSLDSCPQYTYSNDLLPTETIPRLIGSTLIPAIMIQDHHVSDLKKITCSPYYSLEKYQYWKKIEYLSLAPGEKRKSFYTYGITPSTQQSLQYQLGLTLHQDGGFTFTDSGSRNDKSSLFFIKQQIMKDLHLHESSTKTTMESITKKYIHTNPFATEPYFHTKYILVTKLVLKRISQHDQDPDIEMNHWIYTDPQTIQTTSKHILDTRGESN